MATGIPSKSSTGSVDLQELIRRRAEEIYYRSGCAPGHDLENWAQAEKEIRQETAPQSARRTAVAINVDGVLFIGEYAPDACHGYTPGEFSKGATVPVRFDGDKMFVKRPDGRELETTIVKKVVRKAS
jgi:hypothetical protein